MPNDWQALTRPEITAPDPTDALARMSKTVDVQTPNGIVDGYFNYAVSQWFTTNHSLIPLALGWREKL